MISRLPLHTIQLCIAIATLVFVTSCAGPSSADITAELEKPIEYAEYDHTTDVVYLFPVEVDGLWGFIDTLGRIVIKPQYEEAGDFSEGFASVQVTDSFQRGFINHKNEMLTEELFDYVGSFQEGYAYVTRDSYYGFIDKSGEIVIPIKFEDVFDFEYGLAIAGKDNKYGLIDTAGNWVLEPNYKDVSTFYDGYSELEGEDGFGLADSIGRLLLEPVYEYIMTWDDGFVEVANEGYSGAFFIGESGATAAVPIKYGDIYYYPEAGLFTADNGDFVHVLTNKGRQIGGNYNDVIDIDTNVIVVEKDWKHSIIDLNGRPLTSKDYEWISGFSEGLAAASIDGKFGFLDKTGNEAIAFDYEHAKAFSEGLACVSKDEKYGYINRSGELIIPMQFDEGSVFVGGVAAVESEGKCGYIDTKGNWAIAPTYSIAYDFDEEGLAFVELGARMGVIDSKGNVIVNMKYHDIYELDFDKGLWEVIINKRSGMANSEQQELLAPEYDMLYPAGDFVQLEKEMDEGLAKVNGEIVLEAIFDEVEDMDRGMIRFTLEKLIDGEPTDLVGYVNSSGEIVWWPYDRNLLRQDAF